jgi:hypothetical protein
MGSFNHLGHKYAVNWHFHKWSLANGLWQVFWGGNIFWFFIKLLLSMKLNIMVVWNEKTNSIIQCT